MQEALGVDVTGGFGDGSHELPHWLAFVYEEADVAAGLGKRQRIFECCLGRREIAELPIPECL